MKQVGNAKLFFKRVNSHPPPSIALEILLLFAFIKNKKIYSYSMQVVSFYCVIALMVALGQIAITCATVEN